MFQKTMKSELMIETVRKAVAMERKYGIDNKNALFPRDIQGSYYLKEISKGYEINKDGYILN